MVKTDPPGLAHEVASLRQELAALEVLKERYHAIVQTAEHIIIGLKPDHTIFEWNKSAEKLYGWTREEAVGVNYLEYFIPQEVRQTVAQDIVKVLAGIPTQSFENPVVTRDGVRQILWNVTRLLNAAAQPYGIVAVGQDITDYKQAEEIARQNAHRYHQLLLAEQRHVRDLALLDRVRTTLARELDVTTLIHIVVEAIAETFGYTLVSLYFLEGDTLILQHQVGYDQVIHKIKVSEGVSGQVARTGQPILLQNVHDDPEFLGAIEGIRSEVSVPLFDQGKVVGTLNVESGVGIQLTEADLALVTALGEHVSIAIERARLYTEVRRSEERFRIMFESAPIGLAITQLDGRLLEVNPAFCRVVGYNASELLAMRVEDISHPGDMKRNEWLRMEMMAGKADNYEMEKRYIAKDGRLIHTILQVALVRDANGNPLYTIDQIVNISERIQIEIAEREQRLLAETLSRIGLALSETVNLPALLNLICRESVNFLQVHSAFIWLVEGNEMIGFAGHGYGHELFVGSRHPKSNQQILAARIIQTNQPEYVNNAQQTDRLDVEIMQKYQCQAILGVPLAKGDEVIGALIILENRNPFRFGPGDLKTASVLASHAAVAIENARLYQDLEKRVAERTYELQAAYEELKKLDKLKAKLIDDISHELRTPTTNVLLYLDLMERGPAEKQARYQQVVRSEVSRLAKLVEGIVHLSDVDLLRAEAHFTAVSPSLLIQHIGEGFQQRAHEKNLDLVIDAPDEVPSIWGDEKQIAEALRHLLTNAINYTNQGQVRVQLSYDTKVCIVVTDTGMGIAPEDLPHIFDRFYRGRGVSQLTFPGAGLGLFIVREIMNLHEGEVTVSSQLHEGSTFRLYFPLVDEAVNH